MKRHGNLWDDIVSLDNLEKAYKAARKGKGWRKSVRKYDTNTTEHLLKLQELLVSGKFRTAKYSEKVIFEPKQRTIYKLPFYPDRIVQHAVLQVLIPIWDNLMINDSYACREGKGMHEASAKTMQHVKKYKYCFKADISKFYPSIVHDVLMRIISRKIKCVKTLELLDGIVRSYPGGKNSPIGNYTSQWFGNLYMNELDQLIRHKYKLYPYIRYCDDFVVFSNDKKFLHTLKDEVQEFLAHELKLKFSRWSVFPTTQGVDFLGYRHFKTHVLLRKGSARRIQKRVQRLVPKLHSGVLTYEQCRSSVASTEGWLKWANTYNFTLSLELDRVKKELQCVTTLNTLQQCKTS